MFGRIVPKGTGGLFEKHVRTLITDDSEIAAVIMPLLQVRQMARSKCAAFDRRLVASVSETTFQFLFEGGGFSFGEFVRELVSFASKFGRSRPPVCQKAILAASRVPEIAPR